MKKKKRTAKKKRGEEKRPVLLRDLETEMAGTSKRASNQANLFNDDAFNNNKSCGGKYALRYVLYTYFPRVQRSASATTCATCVHDAHNQRSSTRTYVRVVRLEWHARIKVSKLQRRTIATRRTMLFSS